MADWNPEEGSFRDQFRHFTPLDRIEYREDGSTHIARQPATGDVRVAQRLTDIIEQMHDIMRRRGPWSTLGKLAAKIAAQSRAVSEMRENQNG